MGARFTKLAPSVAAVHSVLRDMGASGRAVVERGRHPIARQIAAVMHLPPEGDQAVHVHFSERDGRRTLDAGL